jgi:hypothetical protein
MKFMPFPQILEPLGIPVGIFKVSMQYRATGDAPIFFEGISPFKSFVSWQSQGDEIPDPRFWFLPLLP